MFLDIFITLQKKIAYIFKIILKRPAPSNLNNELIPLMLLIYTFHGIICNRTEKEQKPLF